MPQDSPQPRNESMQKSPATKQSTRKGNQNAQDASKPSRAHKRVSTFKHYRILLGKDLRREFRTKEMLSSMGIYTLIVLIVFGTTLTQATESIDVLQMSGGLFWALIVFTSLLGLNRSFSYEKEDGALEGILLVPLDRSVIFLSKVTANLLFLLIVEIIAIPLFFVFFLGGTPLHDTLPLAFLPLLVGTIGIAGVGTLLATITINTRGKDVLLALLFVPLIFPLLYACVSATTLAITGSTAISEVYVPALALAAGYDVIMILVAWLFYDFVVSA